MSRGGDRSDQRTRPTLVPPHEPSARTPASSGPAPGWLVRGEVRPAPASGRIRPEREEARRYREERQTDLLAHWRLTHPTIAEQQMVAALAAAGERYGVDYEREFKIAPCLHVDFAFPEDRLIVEMYGGIHSREFFSRGGARESDDARRIGRIKALGWEVLVIDYRALSQERWAATVDRVAAFLEEGRGRWSAPTSVEARTHGVQAESE